MRMCGLRAHCMAKRTRRRRVITVSHSFSSRSRFARNASVENGETIQFGNCKPSLTNTRCTAGRRAMRRACSVRRLPTSSVHRQRPRRRERIRLGSNNHNGDDHDDRDRIHTDGLHSPLNVVQRHIRSMLAATLTFLTCDWNSPAVDRLGRSCQCCSSKAS